MARLDGGIFSRPRGKTANIVFGAARTRKGKVVTARELVRPSNPNTSAQQTQRSKFKEALEITRKVGKAIYGSDLNRAVSQLPGFQGLMSIIMNNMDDNYDLSKPSNLNLGSLGFTTNFTVETNPTGPGIFISQDPDSGSPGEVNDPLVQIYVAVSAGATATDREVHAVVMGSRTEIEPPTPAVSASTDFIALCYYRGSGQYSGLLSEGRFFAVTSGS